MVALMEQTRAAALQNLRRMRLLLEILSWGIIPARANYPEFPPDNSTQHRLQNTRRMIIVGTCAKPH